MRALTKIKLINWHYFTNETIPVEGSALITGSNKAGKSTLIDALQVAVVANLKKIRFNSAAFDERTERDLKGYLKGRTGTEGGFSCLRGENEDFSSYIVLELTRTETNRPYLFGVVFDYYSESGEEEHTFFKIDEHPMEEQLFLEDGYPRNRQQFFLNLKTRNISYKQYKNDVEGYRSDLRQLFGGVKDSFFSLFSKGISFRPITNLRKFVYDYILDERPVDVDTMRDYAERYRQMENEIYNTNAEIKALEEECAEYEKVEKLRRQEMTGRYMQYRGELEQKRRELDGKEKEHGDTQRALEETNSRLEELEKKHEKLKSQWEDLVGKITDNETARRERELQQKIKDLDAQLKDLSDKRKNLEHQVRAEAKEIDRFLEVLKKVEAPHELTNPLLEAKETWENFLKDGRFPAEPEDLSRPWKENMEWLLVRQSEWDKQKKELEEQARRLKQEIENLKKGQRLDTASSTMKLKNILMEHLVPEKGGEQVPVHVFCEVTDIRDLRWQNAIEGYLHTQKFDLLVPPGYFDQALEVYERHKFTHGIESVGLVNTEKLVKTVKKPLRGSLAEEITAKEDYVRAYVHWLMGGVIKCDSEQELKRHKRAITDTCMLYQNHTARQIPKKRYEVPYIGRKAIKVQLQNKREELEGCTAEIAALERRLELAREVSRFNSDKHHLYLRWQEIHGECSRYEELARELWQVQQELLTLDRSELERLEKEKESKEIEIRQCEDEIGRYRTRLGELQNSLQVLEQEARNLNQAKEECGRRYNEYLERLPEDMLEFCHNKWDQEVQSREPETLAHNYRVNAEGLKSKIDNQMSRVINLRHEFSRQYDFLADINAEDNRKWEERLQFLKETSLPEYQGQATEAREKAEQALKEHFLSRLHESIRLAHEEIDELNRALKDLEFGGYSYRFKLTPRQEMRDYYDMIVESQMGTEGTLFSDQFKDKHSDAFKRLFEEITAAEGEEKGAQELTDYRSYLDFDIVITDDHGNKSYFSKISRTESGGGAQIPFYVAILASFYQAYHMYRKRDTLRLVVFDEAFNRMDADNIEECMRFIQKLGFQALLVEPTGKIRQLVPFVQTNIIVMRDGFVSFVERVTRKKIEEWVEQEQAEGAEVHGDYRAAKTGTS